MMKAENRVHLPARILSLILVFLMSIFLFIGCVLCEGTLLMSVRSIHEAGAKSEQVQSIIETRISKKVMSLAAQYHFDADRLIRYIDRQEIAEYTDRCIDWWMSLPQKGFSQEIPVWDSEKLIPVIREDEEFQANNESYLQRSIARDKIAYAIEKVMVKSVFPIRTDVLAPVLEKAQQKINIVEYTELFPWVLAAVWLFVVLCAVLIRLLCIQNRKIRSVFTGCAFGANAILLLSLVILMRCMDIPGIVRASSEIFSLQLESLVNRVSVHLVILAAVNGMICILFYNGWRVTLFGKKTTEKNNLL